MSVLSEINGQPALRIIWDTVDTAIGKRGLSAELSQALIN